VMSTLVRRRNDQSKKEAPKKAPSAMKNHMTCLSKYELSAVNEFIVTKPNSTRSDAETTSIQSIWSFDTRLVREVMKNGMINEYCLKKLVRS